MMKGERLNVIDSHESVDEMRENRDAGTADQFFKLIEHDEGVPFRLVFGNEKRESRYLFMGNSFEKITGISSELFSEKKFRNMIEEIIPLSQNIPADPAALKEKILSGEVSDYRMELKIALPHGEKKWLRESSIRVRDELTGNITGIMGIFHDITEKKMFLSHLNEAREKAGECDRLKTNFLQNISHEVRTPLNAIVGFSTLLCENDLIYSRRDEYVKLITRSTERFLEVMDNILEISKIEAGSVPVVYEEVNPSVVLRKAFELYKPVADDSCIGMNLLMPETELTIMADDCKLVQILNRLVSNAIKFTHSGKVELGFTDRGSSIEFFVSDTGIGIPDRHKPFIFNKFYQVDTGSTRSYNGVGLGLTISKAYAAMMGGTVTFESTENQGSTFRVILSRTPIKS